MSTPPSWRKGNNKMTRNLGVRLKGRKHLSSPNHPPLHRPVRRTATPVPSPNNVRRYHHSDPTWDTVLCNPFLGNEYRKGSPRTNPSVSSVCRSVGLSLPLSLLSVTGTETYFWVSSMWSKEQTDLSRTLGFKSHFINPKLTGGIGNVSFSVTFAGVRLM